MTTPVTTAEVEALEALLKKATKRPWTWFTSLEQSEIDGGTLHIQDERLCQIRFLVSLGCGQGFAHTVGLDPDEDTANARLIVAAVNALPRLLAALRAQDAAGIAREAARRACQEIAGNPVLLTSDAVDAIVDRAIAAAVKDGGA